MIPHVRAIPPAWEWKHVDVISALFGGLRDHIAANFGAIAARLATADAMLGAMLAFVEQLSEVDIEGVAPMTSVTPMEMKKRADVVTERMAAVETITHTHTLIAYKAFSQHDLERLFSIGADDSLSR